MRMFAPLTLSDLDLRVAIKALQEVSVYDLSDEEDEARERLLDRMQVAADQQAARVLLDQLHYGELSPQDITDACTE